MSLLGASEEIAGGPGGLINSLVDDSQILGTRKHNALRFPGSRLGPFPVDYRHLYAAGVDLWVTSSVHI